MSNQVENLTTGRASNKYYTHLGKRLCELSVGIKTYWRTLHKIINKKQAMNIPPILLDGVFIKNFQNKANLFNDFFVQQCSVLRKDSALPNMEYKTAARKSNISVTEDKIVKIIRKLNSNKAHGCDNMSVRMLKICDTAIAGPLKLIYEKCLDTGRYPCLWNKAIIVPARKKNSHQILKNYRPISLLSIWLLLFCLLELVFVIFSPTTTSSSIQVGLLWSIVSDVIVNITCWIIFHDVFCAGNGGDKPTSVLCCGYQHGLITRASVTYYM